MKAHNMLNGETVPYDSQEARAAFQLARIQALEAELEQLNLLEHPREIEAICKEIIAIKEIVGKIAPVTK